MKKILVVFAAIAVLALGLLAAGCGGEDAAPATPASDEGPRLAEQWAGAVEDTDAYISVFTLDDGQAGAYLADGAEIATLVLGTRDGNTLDLEPSEDVEVTASVDGDAVSGTVSVGGAQYGFSAQAAGGEAGWYRARTEVDGDPVAAGYIVLADGTQRGAVRRAGNVVANPEFAPSSPTIEVDDIGELDILPVAEFVIQEGGLS